MLESDFVHEGAKLLHGIAHDKLSRLAGKYNNVLDAAAAGAKPRPKLPLKPSLESALGGAGNSDLDTLSREAESAQCAR